MARCVKCGGELTADAISLHRKMVHRQATEFLCRQCLADLFQVDVSVIDKKIKQFKEQGCRLFVLDGES